MVALQIDRSGSALVTIQRATRRTGNDLIGNHGSAVEDDSYASADEGDVVRLPLAGRVRRALVRRQKTIHSSNFVGARNGTSFAVLDLHLVSAAEVNAAVAPLRIAELDVQLEVGELRVTHDIPAASAVRQHTVV